MLKHKNNNSSSRNPVVYCSHCLQQKQLGSVTHHSAKLAAARGGKKHTHTFMSAFNIHSFSLLIKLHSKLLDVSTNKKEKTTTHLLQASRISFSSTGESTITIASVLSPIIEQASILLPIRLFLSDYLKKIYKSLLISDRVN